MEPVWCVCVCRFHLPLPLTGQKPRLTHLSGSSVDVPDGLSVSAETEIFDNCMDARACIMIGSRPLVLREWFGKQDGPNGQILANAKGKVIATDAEKFARQIQAELSRTSAAGVASGKGSLAHELEDNRKRRAQEQAAARKPSALAPGKRRRGSGCSAANSSAAAGEAGKEASAAAKA